MAVAKATQEYMTVNGKVVPVYTFDPIPIPRKVHRPQAVRKVIRLTELERFLLRRLLFTIEN